MNRIISDRVIKEALYIISTNDTVRDIAKIFNVSKSTVHKDLRDRLKEINIELYNKVNLILKHHIDIRHIRGGESTRLKYLNK
nr:sporulation transcriptional regulator SpoIIID [Bacilli bacterium]